MARVSSVSEINEMDAKEVIHLFKGKITKFLFYKDGVGKEENGTLQMFLMKDKDGDEIKIKAWDRDRIPEKWRGCEVSLLASKTQRGWSGVWAEDDEYNGETARIIKLGKSAEVIKGGSSGSHDEEREEEEDRSERHSGKRSNRHEEEGEEEAPEEREAPRKRGSAMNEAKDRLVQCTNLYSLCYRAANYFGETTVELKSPLSAEHFQAMTSTMFIQMARDGYIDSMPKEMVFESEGEGEEESPEEDAPEAEETDQSGEGEEEAEEREEKAPAKKSSKKRK